MNEVKQIEKMAKDICDYARGEICILDDKKCDMQCTSAKIAKKLTAKGYSKQSEGEWIKPTSFSQTLCSKCRMTPKMLLGLLPKYCPNCGAKMKGGAE